MTYILKSVLAIGSIIVASGIIAITVSPEIKENIEEFIDKNIKNEKHDELIDDSMNDATYG